MTDEIKNNDETSEEMCPEEERKRNFFDKIGDFFAKMLKGIFIFVFCKLPVRIWKIITNIEQLKKLLKWLYSFLRAVVLCVLWICVVFLGWWYFLNEQFIRFWCGVWEWTCHAFTNLQLFLKVNAGWIWMILALCGSCYGLLYVSLKRRKKRKQAQAAEAAKTAESAVEPTPPEEPQA